MSVLLIDGDNLTLQGFYGVKNYFYKGIHIGGIYHFLNTIRKSFETYNLDKVVVFWDGENSSYHRQEIYPQYKANRNGRVKTVEEETSYNYQRSRIKGYLEEIFVRQGEYPYCETDDCIAYYVHNSPNEKKIIYSSDGDLTQLVSEKTRIYNPSHGKIYNSKDLYNYSHENILIENVKIAKMICGDPSDNISGIKNMGIKRIISLFPEILTQPLSIEYIKHKSSYLSEIEKDNNVVKNLLTGVTKDGVLGDEFFTMNNKIINLDEPFLTDEAKENINELINDTIDPEGRSYKHTMKMMMEDGLFNILPKTDSGWINFMSPFLKLERKEKNKILVKHRN